MDVPNTYLFTAYYDEGDGRVTLYQQDPEDRSIQKPDEKNAFFDICYQPIKPIEQLYAFTLEARPEAVVPDEVPRKIGVNLRTGQFEADGRLFSLHNHLMDDYESIGPMRLQYFRDVAQIQEVRGEQTLCGYRLGYLLGWQATVVKEGVERNLKKFISITGVPTLLS